MGRLVREYIMIVPPPELPPQDGAAAAAAPAPPPPPPPRSLEQVLVLLRNMEEKVNVLRVEVQELRGRVPSEEQDLERFMDETRGSHFELENQFNTLSVVQDTMVTEMRHHYDNLKLMTDEQHRDSSHTEGPEGAADDWVEYVEVDRTESGPHGQPAET